MHTNTLAQSLTPLFKWTGGKRREIKHFEDLLPDYIQTGSPYKYVEPFVGGGALYWHLNNVAGRNVINDFDTDLANFYRHVQTQDEVFLQHIRDATELFAKNLDPLDSAVHAAQEANYYHWRDMDRDGGLAEISLPERAARFWIVNQLSFSGMRRFNRRGEFNVAFGHYKTLNASALESAAHVQLLNATEVHSGDYREVILANDTRDTFIFIDPPYTRVMNTYSADNEFDLHKQSELADTLKSLRHAHFMVVINRDEDTEALYRDHIVAAYDLRYGANILNRFDQRVQHLVATNY